MEHLTLYDPEVWNTFIKPGEVVEARFIKVQGRATWSGYFDDHAAFCQAVQATDKMVHSGAYFTLQAIDPRLIGRAFNRIKQTDLTTSDTNVLAYRWLPIDMDPARPSGISSSDSELEQALILRGVVEEHLKAKMGLARPVRAMSGNGGHLLFRLPNLPVTDENKKLVQNILIGLAKQFDTDTVKIDTTVFNPARIWKLYGTTARKGDPVPAGPVRESRPHRQSYIEELGESL